MTDRDSHHVTPEGAILTRRQGLFDLVLTLLLAATYVVAENLSLPKRWILPAITLAMAGFALHVSRRGNETLADLGFTRSQLRRASLETALFTIAAAAGILTYAALTGSRPWLSSMALLLPIYPLYGLAQQAIFQGIIHRRLLLLLGKPWLCILLTSLAFALVHLGNSTLVALTFVAGFFWSWIYARHPNLWPLGISHGILAALTYPLVLGDNPLQRF